jgi:hypothetical protein
LFHMWSFLFFFLTASSHGNVIWDGSALNMVTQYFKSFIGKSWNRDDTVILHLYRALISSVRLWQLHLCLHTKVKIVYHISCSQ